MGMSSASPHKGDHFQPGMEHVTITAPNMARLRWKMKRLLLVLLVACLVWLMYLLTLLPSKGQSKSEIGEPPLVKSISREHLTRAPTKDKPHVVEPKDNVLDPPQVQVSEKAWDSAGEKVNEAAKLALKFGLDVQNNSYKSGMELKNNTLDIGEKMKNKTLEQLAVMGVVGGKEREMPQLVVVPLRWNLSVSFGDIGEIMKETKFMSKVDLLNLQGPVLLSSRNRTANFTLNMPLKFGFCDCFEHYCLCCGRLTNAKLHLNATACTNFTFISKTHELDLSLSLDAVPVYQGLISADKPPVLCIGSSPEVAEMCLHFFNMTYKVNEHNAHQTQLLGCFDFSLNFFNRTIGAFPVDCFQIPGDPNVVHKERVFNMVFNWMP